MSELQYQIIHSIPGRVRLRLHEIYLDASLAAGLENLLSSQEGVCAASANADCASVTISFDSQQFDPLPWLSALELSSVKRIEQLNHVPAALPAPLAALKHGTFAFEALMPPKVQCLLGAVSLALTFLQPPLFLTRTALSLCLLPIINRALQTLLDERRLSGDALDSATCVLFLMEGSFLPAALTSFLIGLGELMRDRVTLACQQMISHQLALSKKSAWLVQGDHRVRVPLSELHPGDRVVVYPGELIATAGTVVAGAGTVVPSSLQQEFVPKDVGVGDSVVADTLLTFGKLYIEYKPILLLKQVDHIHEKQKRRWFQRTRLHKFALRAAHDRVWPTIAGAALMLVATRSLHRAAEILCFDFVTGVRIAIPTALLSSMYRAGKHGIIMRNASALESLSEVDVILFASSGTLTQMKPFVTDVFACNGFSVNETARLSAAVLARYNYLGAHSIYSYAHTQSIAVPARSASNIIPGLGVAGEVEGHSVLVGSTRLMQMRKIDLSSAHDYLAECMHKGDLRICVAIDDELAGIVAYQDPVREEAADVVGELKELGLNELAVMTSGRQDTARRLADSVGINTVHARTLPEDMAQIVKDYQSRGHKVAVVGDDMADSLALDQADVAVTLSHGADVARYRADVVLTAEGLTGLAKGIRIARDGMALAKQNLVVVSVPNWLGLSVSVINQSGYLTDTLLNNGSVIIGAANGFRPLLDPGEPT